MNNALSAYKPTVTTHCHKTPHAVKHPLRLHLRLDCTNLRPHGRRRMVYDTCLSEGETGDVEMSGDVYIIGAGASAGYGAPTFSDFFDKAEKIMNDESADVDKERFRSVIDVHRKCFPSFNIEQFYSLLELEEELVGFACEKSASELKKDTLYLISATIKHSLKNEMLEGASDFIKKLDEDATSGNSSKITIINLNWDLLFDSYFFENCMRINYGHESCDLDGLCDNKYKPKPSALLKILKLHGSLNWLVCPECIEDDKKIFFVRDYIIGESYEEDENRCCAHCGCQLERLIVPPVFTKLSKDPKYEPMKDIWRLAEYSLVEAERIHIMGYSFPVTDTQFESFFINSLIKNKSLGEVIIVTYPKYGREKMEFEGRYASIFRHTGHYEKISFEHSPFEKYIKSEDDSGRYLYQPRVPPIKIKSI